MRDEKAVEVVDSRGPIPQGRQQQWRRSRSLHLIQRSSAAGSASPLRTTRCPAESRFFRWLPSADRGLEKPRSRSVLAAEAGRLGLLRVDRGVARNAVKVAAMLCPNNLKAFGNTIHMRVPPVCLRKPGNAGLSANRTPKIFYPAVQNDHSSSMRFGRSTFQIGTHDVPWLIWCLIGRLACPTENVSRLSDIKGICCSHHRLAFGTYR